MITMYCNFTKSQAFPLAFRVSSKPQFYVSNSYPKLISDPSVVKYRSSSYGFIKKPHKNFKLLGTGNSLVGFNHEYPGKELGFAAKPRCFSSGFRPPKFGLGLGLGDYPLMKARSFSTRRNVDGNGYGVTSAGKSLPWLAKNKSKEVKNSEKPAATKSGRSSWEEAAEKFLKSSPSTVETRESRKFDRKKGFGEMSRFDRRNGYRDKRKSSEDEAEEEIRAVDDTGWDRIKNRFDRIVDVNPTSQGPEVRKWNRQENWGQKTWKEATESTIPKMVGEGIYGVGPVLAALAAGRREFYALYIQEGLDLSGNNRKKKDKKGFEKVLRAAEKLGLSKKEMSKHDLNMIVDNRPHQGLVLDASPLEMVNIRELDRVLADGEMCPLWVALDEVTDPQNLGAIIRSAYFFGASGVVLCAKNSAPLSGVVSKASAGSLELTELRSCKNMMQFLISSAENGWRVLGGSVSSRAVPLNEVATGEPTILVLGSEGIGLRPLVERSCTQLIRIPGNFLVNVSSGFEDGEELQTFLAVESLNVSVAAGVLLHHLVGSNNSHSCQLREDEQICATG